MKLFLTLSLQR